MLLCYRWTRVALLRSILVLFLLPVLLSGKSGPSGAQLPDDKHMVSVVHAHSTINPPANLRASTVMNSAVILAWNPVMGASSYRIYRSSLAGLGFQRIASIAASGGVNPTYTDNHLVNQIIYYYKVTAMTAEGEESSASNEVAAVPALVINHATIDEPEVAYAPGGNAPLVLTARYWIEGRTTIEGPPPGILSQVVYGESAQAPAQWTHQVDVRDSRLGPQCCYQQVTASFMPDPAIAGAPGSYRYTFRFSSDLGRTWTYAGTDLQPVDPNSVLNENLGMLNIITDSDDAPPIGPSNLRVVNIQSTSATLEWDAGTDTDSNPLWYYDVFRSLNGAPSTLVARVDGIATMYQDFGLAGAANYTYTVRAVDNGFNYSPEPDPQTMPPLPVTTSASPVQVTVNIRVPEFTPLTPEGIYISRQVDSWGTYGETDWDATPVQCSTASWICTTTFIVQQGADFSFAISRGSAQTVETTADGHTPIPERRLAIVTTAPRSLDIRVQNWDDPLIVSHDPETPSAPIPTTIRLTWNQVMPPGTSFTVERRENNDPPEYAIVPGAFAISSDENTAIFTPAAAFDYDQMLRIHSGQPVDLKGIPQQNEFTFSFTIREMKVLLPLILRH